MNNSLLFSSLNEVPDVAEKIIQRLKSDGKKRIAFFAEMGAGKTTLIKELCKQLGVLDTVTSPTFSIVNEYKSREGDSFFHFDFYRISDIEEVYDLGYEDYFFSDSWIFIEWSENVKDILPEDFVCLSIEMENDKRMIRYLQ